MCVKCLITELFVFRLCHFDSSDGVTHLSGKEDKATVESTSNQGESGMKLKWWMVGGMRSC